jgi:Leu/Phe-tRNA-protein transferase
MKWVSSDEKITIQPSNFRVEKSFVQTIMSNRVNVDYSEKVVGDNSVANIARSHFEDSEPDLSRFQHFLAH